MWQDNGYYWDGRWFRLSVCSSCVSCSNRSSPSVPLVPTKMRCGQTASLSLVPPPQQLRANVREMEMLCARVRAEDASALEALVRPVRDRATAAVQDFLLLHSRPVSQPPPAAARTSDGFGGGGGGEEPTPVRQIQLQLPEIPADQSAAESWDNLEEVSRALSAPTLPNSTFLAFRVIIATVKMVGCLCCC